MVSSPLLLRILAMKIVMSVDRISQCYILDKFRTGIWTEDTPNEVFVYSYN